MNQVFAAALEVQQLFQERKWKFCLIGGLAVIRWGRRRATEDADFSLLTGIGDEREFLDIISDRFPEREPNEVDFAVAARVYSGFAPSGAPVDIGLAAFPYEAEVIGRAPPHTFRPGCTVMTCSAEDLIVMKAFAGREIDTFDLRYLMANHWLRLNWQQIERDLRSLCDWTEKFDAVPRFESLRAEVAEKLKRE